jgi:amino acid transporter
VHVGLDARIACVVPFNFGGPQPETVFPLPADADAFNYAGGGSWESTRNLRLSARDGFLPAALGRVSARSGVPTTAIVVHATIAVALAVTGTFEQLAVLSVLASCLLYIGACLAAWRLDRRGVALAGPPLKLRWLMLFVVVGVAGNLAAIALARPIEIAALVGSAAAAAGLYAIMRRRRAA